jgi:hypothetical protein
VIRKPVDQAHEAEICIRAARRAHEIVKREGGALAISARELDDAAIAADSHLLAIAIAQAIVDAYAGDLDGIEGEEPSK